MTKPQPTAPVSPVLPCDGWERSQRETIPELYRECREKAARLDAESGALREKMQMLERVASAMGFQVERPPKAPSVAPVAVSSPDRASGEEMPA